MTTDYIAHFSNIEDYQSGITHDYKHWVSEVRNIPVSSAQNIECYCRGLIEKAGIKKFLLASDASTSDGVQLKASTALLVLKNPQKDILSILKKELPKYEYLYRLMFTPSIFQDYVDPVSGVYSGIAITAPSLFISGILKESK